MKDTAFSLALAAIVLVVAILMVALFKHNLPGWCAHPERPGNWLVVPLCSKV